MMLTAAQRLASRELGLLIDSAVSERLALHGFVAIGFGCVARDGSAPYSPAHALAVCVEEATEPVIVASARQVHADSVGPSAGDRKPLTALCMTVPA